MTESKMEALAQQEDADAQARNADPRDKIEFKARAVPYSSVVGSSIMLLQAPDGPVIGQLALLLFGEDQQYWAERITRALNNGARAETAIAHFLAKGLIKTSRDMPAGQGGAVRARRSPVDVREFVKSLDAKPGDSNHGTAIRGDEKAPDRRADEQGVVPNVRQRPGDPSVV